MGDTRQMTPLICVGAKIGKTWHDSHFPAGMSGEICYVFHSCMDGIRFG
jgi:hypothetical protein